MTRRLSREASREPDLLRDSRAAARAARLHYVEADEEGLTRAGRPGRFRIVDARGRLVRDAATLARVRALAIPPAWTRVWISAREDGHIQATGFDALGRKQYRYHAEWRKLRDQAKYKDILPFVRALPLLRERVRRDLARREPCKEQVVATVLGIMERTQIRVGNEKYARANGSYGLTTLRSHHARVRGRTLELRFRGKSGKLWRTALCDAKLAASVARCRALGGKLLFQYVAADGERHAVSAHDVNEYIRACTGQPFTAKEFRTWSATMQASLGLCRCEPCTNQRAAKKTLLEAVAQVAEKLGNTVAVCRKSYVDPRVFECYLRGELGHELERALERARQKPRPGLSPEENAVSALLEGLSSARPTGPVVALREAARRLRHRSRERHEHQLGPALASSRGRDWRGGREGAGRPSVGRAARRPSTRARARSR